MGDYNRPFDRPSFLPPSIGVHFPALKACIEGSLERSESHEGLMRMMPEIKQENEVEEAYCHCTPATVHDEHVDAGSFDEWSLEGVSSWSESLHFQRDASHQLEVGMLEELECETTDAEIHSVHLFGQQIVPDDQKWSSQAVGHSFLKRNIDASEARSSEHGDQRVIRIFMASQAGERDVPQPALNSKTSDAAYAEVSLADSKSRCSLSAFDSHTYEKGLRSKLGEVSVHKNAVKKGKQLEKARDGSPHGGETILKEKLYIPGLNVPPVSKVVLECFRESAHNFTVTNWKSVDATDGGESKRVVEGQVTSPIASCRRANGTNIVLPQKPSLVSSVMTRRGAMNLKQMGTGKLVTRWMKGGKTANARAHIVRGTEYGMGQRRAAKKITLKAKSWASRASVFSELALKKALKQNQYTRKLVRSTYVVLALPAFVSGVVISE